MHLVYGEHEEADLLDDGEGDDYDEASFNNLPLLSAPHPEQHHPSIPDEENQLRSRSNPDKGKDARD
jgi:hypothetical protein